MKRQDKKIMIEAICSGVMSAGAFAEQFNDPAWRPPYRPAVILSLKRKGRADLVPHALFIIEALGNRLDSRGLESARTITEFLREAFHQAFD